MENVKQPNPRIALMFERADKFELNLCQQMNQFGRRTPMVGNFFRVISRLGDGVFWYSLMLALPFLDAQHGLESVGHIAVVSIVCVALYKVLKNHMVRERPFISFSHIQALVAPLDHYSFPSGHTMNAMNFAVLFSVLYPPLFWLVVPFAILVGLSRVILGMHYPTDVIVGAVLGSSLASISFWVWPHGIFG